VFFESTLFVLSALLAVGGAIMTAASKNVIHASIYLLASLIGVAGLYATLGADFVAATQLVVYVGGVVILVLFAIMLTGGVDVVSNTRFGFRQISGMGNAKTYAIAVVSAVVVSYVLLKVVLRSMFHDEIVNATIESTVEKIGTALVTKHVLAFEISSVLLLGALVGAAIIARPSVKEEK